MDMDQVFLVETGSKDLNYIIRLEQYYSLHNSLSLSKLKKYTDLFSDKLGTLQSTTAQLFVDAQAVSWYFKARPVAYILNKKVEKRSLNYKNWVSLSQFTIVISCLS